MTRFLASVKDKQEAEIVIRCGADILDLKNPMKGALGALPFDSVTEIVKAYNNLIPISATVGDIDEVSTLDTSIQSMSVTGVDIIKAGYFPNLPANEFIEVINGCADKGLKIVIVFFADIIDDIDQVSSMIHRCKAHGFMLDTALKRGNLLLHQSIDDISTFVEQVRLKHKLVGLAGSLGINEIDVLVPVSCDYLGFRGALCEGHTRTESINELAVSRVRQKISSAHDHRTQIRDTNPIYSRI